MDPFLVFLNPEDTPQRNEMFDLRLKMFSKTSFRKVSEFLFVLLQLCKAGLKTLQDLGPEMRLALNEDLEEEEEEALMEDEEEGNAAYKVLIQPPTDEGLTKTRFC